MDYNKADMCQPLSVSGVVVGALQHSDMAHCENTGDFDLHKFPSEVFTDSNTAIELLASDDIDSLHNEIVDLRTDLNLTSTAETVVSCNDCPASTGCANSNVLQAVTKCDNSRDPNEGYSIELRLPECQSMSCPLCDYICNESPRGNRAKIRSHMRTKHNLLVVYKVVCSICDFKSVASYAVKIVYNHMKKEHPASSLKVVNNCEAFGFECNKCNRKFPTNSSLTNHLRRHTFGGEKSSKVVPLIKEASHQIFTDVNLSVKTKVSDILEKCVNFTNSNIPKAVVSKNVPLTEVVVAEEWPGVIFPDWRQSDDYLELQNNTAWISDGTISLWARIWLQATHKCNSVGYIDPIVSTAACLGRYDLLLDVVRLSADWFTVIMPLHADENHWVVVIFQRMTNSITVYDSMSSVISDEVNQFALQVFSKLLWRSNATPLVMCGPCPKQRDLFNCGIFAMEFIARVLTGKSMCTPENETDVLMSPDKLRADMYELLRRFRMEQTTPKVPTMATTSIPVLRNSNRHYNTDKRSPLVACVCETFVNSPDWAVVEETVAFFTSEIAPKPKKLPLHSERGGKWERRGKRRRKRRKKKHMSHSHGPSTRSKATPSSVPSESALSGDHVEHPSQPKKAAAPARPFASFTLAHQYKMNSKRAMEKILKAKSSLCDIPIPEIRDHFTKVMNKEYDVTAYQEFLDRTMPKVDDSQPLPLLDPFSPEDVTNYLSSVHNSAPGEDGIRYAALKQTDPKGEALCAIYNACLKARKVPSAWKKAEIILLHKKGNPHCIDNWRPIALSSTLYKVYTGMLAKRLMRVCTVTNTINETQKGFMQTEGCQEHIFVLNDIIHRARNLKSLTNVVWLDFSNAFGSIPHAVISASLNALGIDPAFVDVVKDLYTDTTCLVRNKFGKTEGISMNSGVKQGDPLSPLLFNISIEPLLRYIKARFEPSGVPRFGRKLVMQAFADDLVFMQQTPEMMVKLLAEMEAMISIMGLECKVEKCGNLVVKGGKAIPFVHCMHNEPMPTHLSMDAYKYLGCPVGIAVEETPVDGIVQALRDLRLVELSELHPWQKIDAIKRFITPRFQYILRAAEPRKGAFEELEKALRGVLRRICGIPPHSSYNYLHADPDKGGLGVASATDEWDIHIVTHGFRLLTSPDKSTKEYAWNTLKETVSRCARTADPSVTDYTDFLNGVNAPGMLSGGGTSKSFWKHFRKGTRSLRNRIQLQVMIPAIGNVELKFNNAGGKSVFIKKDNRSCTCALLNSAIKNWHFTKLSDGTSLQGRAFASIANDSANNLTILRGQGITYADWKFVHRARLNLIWLKGNFSFQNRKADISSPRDTKCRRCGFPYETLQHVLGLCPCSMGGLVTDRHNALLYRLMNVIQPRLSPFAKVRYDRTCNAAGRNKRPDVVIEDRALNRAYIIDATCPFEKSSNSFKDARAYKMAKYQPEASAFKRGGMVVVEFPFLVGPLGSWDCVNDKFLGDLKVSKRAIAALKRQCVAEAIKFSRIITYTHILGNRYEYHP
jgi:hypothetical protein